jgi:hypothetical protein
MKSLKKILCVGFAMIVGNITLNGYALDQMAKEENTPPPTEGAITTEQLSPLFNTNNEKKEEALNTIPSPSTSDVNKANPDITTLFKTG